MNDFVRLEFIEDDRISGSGSHTCLDRSWIEGKSLDRRFHLRLLSSKGKFYHSLRSGANQNQEFYEPQFSIFMTNENTLITGF